MANMEEIERELRQYVEDSKNLDQQDRYIYIKAIFDKHFALEKTTHVLTVSDFQDIVSNAKTSYANTVMPMKISKRVMYPNESSQVLLIEAAIMYLNKMSVLRKLVKIDYTK